MTEQAEYWEGATWVYHATVTNDGTNSGTHEYDVIPGAGNELEILYGLVFNGDTSARTIVARIQDADGGNFLAFIVPSGSIAAAGRISFPVNDPHAANSAANAGARFLLSGTMSLNAQVQSIAVNQDSEFGIACRIRGGLPSVVFTSPTGATETVNTNQVF